MKRVSEHEHHWHPKAPAFAISVNAEGQPTTLGQELICCYCAAVRMAYIGNFSDLADNQCGAHVSFQAPPQQPKLVQASADTLGRLTMARPGRG